MTSSRKAGNRFGYSKKDTKENFGSGNNMEELLNKLIEKGWKPFGMEHCDKFIIESNGDMCFRWKIPGTDGESVFDYNYDYFKIRELVSKESGLWQFVCENNLVPIMCTEEWIKHYYDNLISGGNIQTTTEYEYRLIESSLKDESELEDFLLTNIVIKDE